ncbi:hypothetical protein AGMMS50239_06890 [Bacteroidia bacterium]|nr:hypothetical protein AGMMS50239_06890 [Bacteroidia bacterium]GHV30324.1 hypothetical protein FACS1894177_02720 [Bacteroidia bacterium]
MKINIPDNINLQIPGRYILTVYVHPEKFSFSFHCPDDLKSYFFYKVDSTGQTDAFSVFKDLFFDNDFFTYPFQRTCILVFSPLYTYVPDAIYSDGYKEDFIKFIFSEKEEKYLDHSIPLAKLRVLYPIPENIYDFFIRSFNEPEFVHYSAPLVTHFYFPDIKHKNQQMFINAHEKGIDIFCFSQKSFLLGNHFPCEKTQDALYYILYTWKQLKMNRFSDLLYVTGERSQNEELIKKLRLYIEQVHMKPLPDGYPFGIIDTKNIPFELAIFSLCES